MPSYFNLYGNMYFNAAFLRPQFNKKLLVISVPVSQRNKDAFPALFRGDIYSVLLCHGIFSVCGILFPITISPLCNIEAFRPVAVQLSYMILSDLPAKIPVQLFRLNTYV